MVTSCANTILWNAHTGSSPPPVVNNQYTNRFLNLHPEYFLRKQKSLDSDRKNPHQPDNIRPWFAKYHAVCEEHSIQPCDQYNFNETEFRIGISCDQWIITQDPTCQAYLDTATNRTLVTVCKTISGDGGVLPPMVILHGAIHHEYWYTTTPFFI